MSRGRRFLVRILLLLVVPSIGLAAAAYIYTMTGRYVSTDNAYVKARKIVISTDLSGRVTLVSVAENQFVKAGQQLFQLDPSPHTIAMKEAEAEISDVRRRLRALKADYLQAAAELKEGGARLTFMDQQVTRYQRLSARGVATIAKYEEAVQDRDAAQQRMAAIKQRMNKVLVSLGGSLDAPVEKHPWYLRAKAAKEKAALRLGYTLVVAPVDGIVSNMRLEEGEYVEEGDPIFVIVETGHVWLEANLKETQLTHVREGQVATFVVDAYPNITFDATVESISPATGAEFSLLPPQNASGNWVKVVQRVPVRFDMQLIPGGPQLRSGMTVTVRIDTKRERNLLTLYARALEVMQTQ